MMDYLAEKFAPGPVFGWLCVAALMIVPLIWYRYWRGRSATVRFSDASLFRGVPVTWALRLRFLSPLFRTLAVLALVLAMARPQSPGAYVDTTEGIAIQMVLDISGSMGEKDFVLDGRQVRRLDAVKTVFRDFVLGASDLNGRPNDLIGMTTFAMFAETPCPLTLDHATLASLLDDTEIPGWRNGRQVRNNREADYTSLGDAIVLATDDLRRAGQQAIVGVPGSEAASSRVMILLTDGADNPPPFRGISSAPDPREAARVAANLGIKIYTIGAVGAQMRRFFGGAQVDETALRDIARITGGKYFRATDTDSLVTVYEEIDQLERRSTGERTFHDNVQAARIAMITALALLMAELFMSSTRWRRVP